MIRLMTNMIDDNMANNDDENADEEINLPDADFSELDEEVRQESGDIEKLRAESEELKDKYIRALAEFENYKKRALKEMADLRKYQGEKILYDMLEIIDNLELAQQYAEADPSKVKEGLDLIHKRFKDTLAKWDVKGESALEKEFDPAKHSAISKVPIEGKKAGTVVNELKKAYFYKDKLLRPGEVVVAEEFKQPEETDESEENT
jgi:molecular chaperone GrpE